MAQQNYRPDFNAHQGRSYDDGSGGPGATWFIVGGLILAALLMYFVYAGGQTASDSPDGLTAPAAESSAPATPEAPAVPATDG
ncbi:MAG: hypothetical protein GKR99_01260 [Rhodobacteraceae bacterium]|nr:hypothetical protein [Paracoccaceae bacterium]